MPKRATDSSPSAKEKRITRYEHKNVDDPRTPETGHTGMLEDELVVGVPLDGSWATAIELGRMDDDSVVVIDMDPVVDPTLFWSGKRSRREVPVLPLQRNEVVAESRIAKIVDKARSLASGGQQQQRLFAALEKEFREADKEKRVEFYTHDEGWKNKLVCGDSLLVMESLLHYEGLRARVDMIYFDPPYGIKYDANFQQRVDSPRNDDKDRADEVLTIRAFRDTWALGVHSYLSHLQHRLYVCRELLADTGSIFVQISDTNAHLVRAVMDEVFGRSNFLSMISFTKTTSQSSGLLPSVSDYLLWYGKKKEGTRYRPLYMLKQQGQAGAEHYDWVELPDGSRRRLTGDEQDDPSTLPLASRIFTPGDLCSSRPARAHEIWPVEFDGKDYWPTGSSTWKTNRQGIERLRAARRLIAVGNTLRYVRYLDDFGGYPVSNAWTDTGVAGFAGSKDYAVQTNTKVVHRCVAMATDPGDLVLDITCGRGTTAFCAEQLGRRWITCDTSRVAVNVARRWLLSAVFPHYVTKNGTVASGFLYDELPRTTMGTITGEKESATIELFDRPRIDRSAIRVSGPFEVLTLGRYSVEDWKGYVVGEGSDAGRLQNYITVIAHLYHPGVEVPTTGGLVHAIYETDDREVGISVGPITGRVTARQIHEAVADAVNAGLDEVHVLGWAFEANVNEVKATLERDHEVAIRLVMIRPDTLAEGLKIAHEQSVFAPLAEPDVVVERTPEGACVVTLNGVAVFDRKRRTTEYKHAGSGYVAAWYLDEDYDGDCFVDCQMFFDFKKKAAIEGTLGLSIDTDEWTLRTASDPFALGRYQRAAVKVVDVFGNESTTLVPLS